MALLRNTLLSGVVVACTAVVPPIVLEDTSAVLAADASTCAAEGHAGSFQHNGGTLKEGVLTFAEYHFDPQESGCYLIEEYHPVASAQCTDLAPQAVPLKINFCKNLTTMGYIDQAVNGGTWNKLATLPFYKGWPASIEITREDLNGRMTACDANGCFWMADAFRLTYIAADCRDPAVRAVMQQDDHNTVAGSTDDVVQLASEDVSTADTSNAANGGQNLADAEAEAVRESAEPTSEADQPRMVLEALLSDPSVEDENAVFEFQPPVDGCYMIEEMHPPVHSLSSAPLTINYCKGMHAVGAIDHTDGRHDRWNYVASLPFYAGKPGGAAFPKSVVFAGENKRSHAFRFTHVGPRCHAATAAPHHITVRITADFSNVIDRLTSFGQQLLQLLADATGVLGERFYMTDLRSGSIVADLTIRPAAAVHGYEHVVGKATAASVARKVTESVETADITSQICGLVGPSLSGCSVSVVSSSIARPQVKVVKPSGEDEPEHPIVNAVDDASKGVMDHIGIIIGGAVGAVLVCVGFVAFCRYRSKKAAKQQNADNKAEVDAEKGNNVSVAKIVKDAAECPEVQKDAEKDGNSDNASTVTPVEQRDEAVAGVPCDSDSGDGSQGSPAAEQK